MHKSKGNISKEIGEENGEVFPSCSNRENLLIRPFTEDVNTRRLFFLFFFWNLDTVQWRIQRRGSRGPAPPPPYFWTKLRSEGPRKFFWETGPPPPPTPTFISRAGPGTAFYKNLAPVKSPAFNKLRGYMNKRHKV